MNNSAIINAIINGIACFANFITGTFVSADVTNRLIPTGGVTNPIARLHTIMIPKWIISIPRDWQIGHKIGAKIKIAGVVSIIHPTNSRNTLMNNNTATFPWKVVNTKLEIASVT